MYKLSELFDVSCKVVVVTGGGSGIGKALATGFAENGAKVYIVGRRLEVLEKAAKEIQELVGDSPTVQCINGDVGTKEGCHAVIDQLVQREERLDTLVNCAGVQVPWKELVDPRDEEGVLRQLNSVVAEDFDYTHRINVNGVFFFTTAAIPLLRKSRKPNVINIASVLGLGISRVSGTLTYSVSKAASVHLGKILAGKLQPFGIRVNTICPGVFPSEMSGQTPENSGRMLSSAEKTVKRAPLGRAGLPEEIIGPTLMLCSRAGGYCDGAVLAVDGGRLLNLGNDDGVGIPEENLLYA